MVAATSRLALLSKARCTTNPWRTHSNASSFWACVKRSRKAESKSDFVIWPSGTPRPPFWLEEMSGLPALLEDMTGLLALLEDIASKELTKLDSLARI